MGISDGFAFAGLQEFFYDRVPDLMESLGIALYYSVIDVGRFISSFLITIVGHVTKKLGKLVIWISFTSW